MGGLQHFVYTSTFEIAENSETHARTQTYTHAHARTYTHAHARTYTHTHNHRQKCNCTSFNMGAGNFPDMYAQSLRATGMRAEGIHIRTTISTYVCYK